MQHDIIDNRERKLAASIKPLLGESERAKFAVSYFFISGFKLVADELEKIMELRLLIGNVSDSQTVEQLACQREAVIRPLAKGDRLSWLPVDRAAKILGLGRSVTYRMQARVFAAAAWGTRQNHPFATGKRSSRVHRFTAPNSTN
jgi:hypothetical protein